MRTHLSENQLARCLVGQATRAELEHSRECPECGAEMSRFAQAVVQYQGSVRQQVNERIALRPTVHIPKPGGAGMQTRRWVVVAAAAAVLVFLPFSGAEKKSEEFRPAISTETDPDTVMNRVNLHLARTVPSPMQPLMLGVEDMNP